ncbi:MAG: NAD(P)H-dependent oxidoreductase [Bacteroidaceae bacterium]|nr:NAD(P)H-dependent oxidoreductase [Prevotellaceae bacterium]MDY5632778.1 NAD(P)H-dependent oxidoreductase [Bacteroidaceae bacterium]
MAKVLLVTGHSYQDYSVANKEIVKELTAAIPDVEVDNLAALYPDFKIDVEAEQQKLLAADTIIVQAPLFWYSMPALVMRWWEEVFTHGWAYGSTGTALKGKRIVFGITAGGPTEAYANNVMGITDQDILNRFRVSATFCNMEYLGGKFTGGLLNDGSGVLTDEARKAIREHVAWIADTIK